MRLIYRPEIDGLRAMAILPVVFYHLGFSYFKGGFFGVDIFFIISGYLITSILLNDYYSNNFSFTNFYIRRARRILPNIIIIIFLISFVSFFIMPFDELQKFISSIIPSLFFFSNFYFSNKNEYFDLDIDLNPLVHTWSLSFEEQFYIIFPLFLFFFLRYFNKKFNLYVVFFIIFLISLCFGQFGGNLKLEPPYIESEFVFFSKSIYANFYLPFARVWELTLGSFLAFFKSEKKINPFLCELFSFLGIGMIVVTVFFFDKNTFHPGFFTLLPCLGSAFVIFFSQQSILAKKILSLNILVFIGLISYSIYIFHFPIISILKYGIYYFDDNFFNFLIFVLIISLSYLNWKYCEEFFRRIICNKKFIIFIIASYIFLLTFVVVFNFLIKKEFRENFILPKNISQTLKRLDLEKKCQKGFSHLEKNFKNLCFFGKEDKNEIDYIVTGDSHANSFIYEIKEFAENNNFKILFLSYPGCPVLHSVKIKGRLTGGWECDARNNFIFNLARKKNIKKILLISRWSYYANNDVLISNKFKNKSTKKIFENSFMSLVNDYEKIGTKVFLIDQIPTQKYLAKFSFIASLPVDKDFNSRLEKKSIDYNDYLNDQKYTKEVFEKAASKFSNLQIINFDRFFCKKNNKCLIGTDMGSYYFDDDHISYEGAKLLRNYLFAIIKQ